jgi:hypothetical protein
MSYYKKENSCYLYVPRHLIFEEYKKLSYPYGKKIVSNEFIKRIGKLAIVVWYFDDGNYNPYSNRIQLCSYCFSYKENKILQKILKEKFNLNFRIFHREQEKQHYLACHGVDTDNFLKFIKENAPYIPKSMTHKMGNFHRGNMKWIEKKRKFAKKREKDYYQNNKERIIKSHKNRSSKLLKNGICVACGKKNDSKNRDIFV